MNKELKEIYRLSAQLFPNISESCKDCNICCKTYGWLLKQEMKEFLKKGYPIVEINKNLYCFDSFIRDKNNKRIINQIPKCLFYKKRECLIHKDRPFDCRLYPIKIKFQRNKLIIGLNLECKYILSLREEEKKKVRRKIIIFFKKAPQAIIHDYFNLMERVHFISKPKGFLMEKIIEMEKNKGIWKMIE